MAEAAGQSTITTRRRGKSEGAFRTISEVALDLDLPQHVLRFWESKFVQIRPLKRGGGRRYYRPEDVALLRRIRRLLYEDGYTIRGVQKLLKQNGGRIVGEDDTEDLDLAPADPASMAVGAAVPPAVEVPPAAAADGTAAARRKAEIRAAIEELEALRERLLGVLK